jgi:isoleucyl-tRNA synthetase
MNRQFKESKTLDLPSLEKDMLSTWEELGVFPAADEIRKDGPIFTFFEGPPTANGRPGIHHVVGRTIKDVFCRYKSLKGYQVLRKGGWDTHGLPVEIEVEKQLGLDGREEVEGYGIAEFNKACRESVLRYKKEWDELTRRIGYWVDLDQPYVTFENNYIESVWWLIKRIYENGQLYKGHKIQWYSPGTGTVLSSHEVSLGYKEVVDPSVFIRFKSSTDPNTSYLAWTTTPWTLISNVALVINPKISYVEIKTASESLILAMDCLGIIDEDYKIVKHISGEELLAKEYEPLFKVDGLELGRNAFKIYSADYVTVEDGTGIVHIAPAFGADDNLVGKQFELPLLNPVMQSGIFEDRTPLVGGLWFKDADKPIIKDLKKRGLLYKRLDYKHNYPHDWRKGTPLMSYPVDSWFVSTTAIKDEMVTANQTINWYPPAIKEGRFGNWLENNVDWALSRKRYWGTPLPIWVSDVPGSDYFEVIGSIEELHSKCDELNVEDAEFDLHRPFVDGITWPSPDGGMMRRVSDVLDVWFDSGAMPFAQWHYPFENKEMFEKHFPADFICEGVDQTRGWFYTLHAIGSLIEKGVAFKNVVVNGLVLDENGEKMSKSKGNTVDPFDVVERFGADVVRWYMMSNSSPWDNMKFSELGLNEVRGKLFGTVENVYRFMASYANIDGFFYQQEKIQASARPELDQWALSRLSTTSAAVDEAFSNYDCTRAARAIEDFVEELSNWYIRRSRPRFWAAKKSSSSVVASEEHDKECAYQTTFDCLLGLSKLMSPIAPFFSDWLYLRLTEVVSAETLQSVHHSEFPETDATDIDNHLEHKMALSRQIVQLALLLRNRVSINVRQPLSRLLVVEASATDREIVDSMKAIILEEVNIKSIEFVDNSDGIVSRTAKANFKTLGPKLGKNMKKAAELIARLSPSDVEKLTSSGTFELKINGLSIELSTDDVEIIHKEIGDWIVAQENGVTVAIDTEITQELRSQGYAREVINRIQSLRKSLDLNLTDRISVFMEGSTNIIEAVSDNLALIQNETLSTQLHLEKSKTNGAVEHFTINDETISISIELDEH